MESQRRAFFVFIRFFLSKMLVFRSKYRQRRLSNDLNIYKLHSDKINFHVVFHTFLIIITTLSSRHSTRKWILIAYASLFTMVIVFSYCTNIQNYFSYEVARFRDSLTHRTHEIRGIILALLKHIDNFEHQYLKQQNISATLSQIVFFIVCGKVMLHNRNVTALYSLLFYNLLSYCVSYIRQFYYNMKRSFFIKVADHSSIKHLAMSAIKIVLEVTHVIAIISMLLALSVEPKGEPTKLFTVFTFVYYFVTEIKFSESVQSLLIYFQFSCFENLETLWTPVLLSIIAQCLSFCFAFILLFSGSYQAALVTFYLNVYLSYKKLSRGSLKILNDEKRIVSQYRYATKSELENFEDVCAVCLMDMHQARVTPCHHIFHADCLRKCLLNCNTCPICKREMIFQ